MLENKQLYPTKKEKKKKKNEETCFLHQIPASTLKEFVS